MAADMWTMCRNLAHHELESVLIIIIIIILIIIILLLLLLLLLLFLFLFLSLLCAGMRCRSGSCLLLALSTCCW